MIVDLHSHVIPGVDDGAADLEEAMAALEALAGDGVERVVATPHFRGSLLERPAAAARRLAALDAAFESLRAELERRELTIRLDRACELKLDVPGVDLADPRLRLAGSRAVLVEFASFQLPPFATNQLLEVAHAGWRPVLAHPERYGGIEAAIDQTADWVAEGVLLQVNVLSLLGGYGPVARQVAGQLIARGLVCCIAGDYHARGRPEWNRALEILDRASVDEPTADGGAPDPRGWRDLLVRENPVRLLGDLPPLPVPPARLEILRGELRRRRVR